MDISQRKLRAILADREHFFSTGAAYANLNWENVLLRCAMFMLNFNVHFVFPGSVPLTTVPCSRLNTCQFRMFHALIFWTIKFECLLVPRSATNFQYSRIMSDFGCSRKSRKRLLKGDNGRNQAAFTFSLFSNRCVLPSSLENTNESLKVNIKSKSTL